MILSRGGVEPPTRGFSVRLTSIHTFKTQSLAALVTPHSCLFRAHFGHTKSGVVANPAIRIKRLDRLSGGAIPLSTIAEICVLPWLHFL